MNEKGKNIINVVLTVLFVVALVIFMFTVSIGLPIYCRFFYYIQINTLKMTEKTPWTYEQIKTAYDEVLNYLTLPGHAFGTGELKWSESGASHFADCKVLFDLNFWGMLCSGIITLALVLLNKFKVIKFSRPFGRHAYLIAAVIAVALPVIIGVLCAIDFDAAFQAFHAIFFPGKDNWVFDPTQDQIIEVMPEEFFMNCAIFIGCGLVTFSAALIIADVLTVRREKKEGEKDGK